MAQDLTAPNVTTQQNIAVQTADVLQNLQTIQTFLNGMVTQFNTLNLEVRTGMGGGGGGGMTPMGLNQAFTGVAYDASSQTLTFTRFTGASMSVQLTATPLTALITELELTTIPAAISTAFNLASTFPFTYHVSGSSEVATLSMFVNNVEVETLSVPTTDGRIMGNFTIDTTESAAIITASATQLDFQLRGTDNSAAAITSNTVSVIRAGDERALFWALSNSNNAATIPPGTMSSRTIIGAGDTIDIELGPTTEGQYIIILAPTTFPVSEIQNSLFGGRDVKSLFLHGPTTRVILGQNFESWVFGPVNGGLTVDYRIVIGSP